MSDNDCKEKFMRVICCFIWLKMGVDCFLNDSFSWCSCKKQSQSLFFGGIRNRNENYTRLGRRIIKRAPRKSWWIGESAIFFREKRKNNWGFNASVRQLLWTSDWKKTNEVKKLFQDRRKRAKWVVQMTKFGLEKKFPPHGFFLLLPVNGDEFDNRYSSLNSNGFRRYWIQSNDE